MMSAVIKFYYSEMDSHLFLLSRKMFLLAFFSKTRHRFFNYLRFSEKKIVMWHVQLTTQWNVKDNEFFYIWAKSSLSYLPRL